MTKGKGKSEDGTKTDEETGGVIAEGMDRVKQDERKREIHKGGTWKTKAER